MNNGYQPPKSPLEVLQKIQFEEAVGPDDKRFVDTEAARGSPRTLERLARKFGLSLASNDFYPASKRHVLLFGHIGSGKSTELLNLAKKLHAGKKLFVVAIDVLNELDHNNLQYTDALMALAKALLESAQKHHITIAAEALAPLEAWFQQHVKTEDRTKEFSAQVEAGLKAETGLPFLGKLFAGFTSAAKTNASYKDSLRLVIRNSYTQFSEAFNELLENVEDALKRADLGQRILFVLDGTDKLSSNDTRRFFIDDAEQLLAINALMLYTAPISLKYDGIQLGKLDDLVLPMIKLADRDDTPYPPGPQALREILLLRCDQSVFADASLIDELVQNSGGHPRELLRLLKLCCEYADERIERADVDKALAALAADYRRFLEPDDYALLVEMDRASEEHGGNNDRTRRLLFRLALLEYNDGSWRRSHPVVRRLEGYQRVARAQASALPPLDQA